MVKQNLTSHTPPLHRSRDNNTTKYHNYLVKTPHSVHHIIADTDLVEKQRNEKEEG